MNEAVGVVLGHQAASSQVFAVGLADDQTLEVDDLVAVTTTDAGGDVTTFGIVTETYAQMEGAVLPSDTRIIAAGEMPGELRTAEAQVIRRPRTLIAPPPASRCAGRGTTSAHSRSTRTP
jgi:hypothetical protein